MRTLVISAALLGGLSLAACEDRSDMPEVPPPAPERQIEPIEEEPTTVVQDPAPYVDEMGGDLETFRNDAETQPPAEIILPEEPATPDETAEPGNP